MANNKIKFFIIMMLISALIIGPIFYCMNKRIPIRQATYIDLCEIDDIGEYLANDILDYLRIHNDAKIDDLIRINGIGESRLEKLKEVYK